MAKLYGFKYISDDPKFCSVTYSAIVNSLVKDQDGNWDPYGLLLIAWHQVVNSVVASSFIE